MNKRNVKSEFELYLPMKNWLQGYLEDNYKGYKIITVDAHSERLDRVLAKYDIVNELAVGVDVQIDVLGIAKRGNTVKLFFIEAKKTNLTLRDLKNTTTISQLCREEGEPIFITKNGYGDMLIMSMETYEKNLFLSNVYGKLKEAKQDMKNGRYSSVEDAVSRIKEKYGL